MSSWRNLVDRAAKFGITPQPGETYKQFEKRYLAMVTAPPSHSHGLFQTAPIKFLSNTTNHTHSPHSYHYASSGSSVAGRAWINPQKVPQDLHYLIIRNYAEDIGQDDYEEDLDWEIIHPDSCQKEVRAQDLDIFAPLTYDKDVMSVPRIHHEIIYLCPLGQEILNAGLDSLDAPGSDWRNLEPGRYAIEQWGHYDSLNQEWDGGLRLVS